MLFPILELGPSTLNTHSDFLKPKLSLEKSYGQGRIILILVIIHGYQLIYYKKVNNEKNYVGLSMFVVLV